MVGQYPRVALGIPLPYRPWLAIFLGGIVVAVADMAVAMGYWATKGVAPLRIVQGIAAGWVGREAARGGAEMLLLGAVTHLSLALAMVAVYWYASQRVPLLTTRPIACGLAYGLLTWAVMMFVVLPLSALGGAASDDPVWRLLHLSSHLFLVGVPSAYLARALAVDAFLRIA